MNNRKLLNKVKTLLSMEVKLEAQKLADGVTVIEAEVFEAGAEVFIVAEDESRVALPVGEYELEDGSILVVVEEGIIDEIKPMEDEAEEEVAEEEVAEEVEAQEDEEVTEDEVVDPMAMLEDLLKRVEALEALHAEDEAAEEVEEVEASTEENKEELSEVKKITHNPEGSVKREMFKFASKRAETSLDKVLRRLNK